MTRNIAFLRRRRAYASGVVRTTSSENSTARRTRPSEALLLSLAVLTARAEARTLHARVIGVHDGDTSNVTDERNRLHRIRIQGIDAPEMDQPLGVDAKRYMRRKVLNKPVTVGIAKRDIYGREVGMVLCDGNDVGLAEIHAGLAWYDKPYASELREDDRTRYEGAESDARQAHRGLWQLRHPQAPWEFRKMARK